MNLLFAKHVGKSIAILAMAIFLPTPVLNAQARRTLIRNVHPLAESENDRGLLGPATKLNSLSVSLKRSATQQSDLDQLLEQQQNPTSSLYHLWLTPEQFAERFGAGQQDIDRITSWLQAGGFSIERVARGHDFIVFSGTAGQVDAALQTRIHRFSVNGEMHYANTSDPSVPEELASVVAGFRGLHDFRPKPRHRPVLPPVPATGLKARPSLAFGNNPGVNFLAPNDLAAIYNVNPLYKSGFDGAGQIVAVAGASDIDLRDIEAFRTYFNLPPNDPEKILVGSENPGVNGAETEADLDLEWVGAVARNATIRYVYSTDVFSAAYYAIDEALAPVLSFSFGQCELRSLAGEIWEGEAEAQKAAVEGITWIASSGDSGAAGCEADGGSYSFAITRLNTTFPASLPWVTAVGGSELNDGGGNYWPAGSAIGYIPEAGWNDENFLLQNQFPGFASGGGGVSWYFTKPSWQSGFGVPNDGRRDVPDVALSASPAHDPYLIVNGGMLMPLGGTSASAPAFAGMVALINQYLKTTGSLNHASGLGLINPMLYTLAQSSPAAFHDITTGSNIVPCVIGSTQDCATGLMGYQAGPGYDLVTGLGSIDIYNLALSWRAAVSKTAHLAVTQFTTSTTGRVGGTFSVSLTVTNEGSLDAGAFRTNIDFTSDGNAASANSFSVYCDISGIPVGASATCSGTVNLAASIKPGTYLMLAIADVNNAVPQVDRSGSSALATTGPVSITQ